MAREVVNRKSLSCHWLPLNTHVQVQTQNPYGLFTTSSFPLCFMLYHLLYVSRRPITVVRNARNRVSPFTCPTPWRLNRTGHLRHVSRGWRTSPSRDWYPSRSATVLLSAWMIPVKNAQIDSIRMDFKIIDSVIPYGIEVGLQLGNYRSFWFRDAMGDFRFFHFLRLWLGKNSLETF